MLIYLQLNTIGVSRDVQLRALKLLDVIVEGDGKEIFQFAYSTMRDRWIRLKQVISESKRFSLQKLSPQYCTFFKRVRDPSPGKYPFLVSATLFFRYLSQFLVFLFQFLVFYFCK